MTLGPLLKRLRENKGWSQRELGRRAGVRYSLISRLESVKQTDTQTHVVLRLAEALGVDVTELLAGDMPEEALLATPHA